jgi:hypothetical protein
MRAGYHTRIFALGGYCRAARWGGFMASTSWGPPFFWGWMSHVGGTLALVFFILWRYRGYFRETIRAVKSGEFHEREALNYKAIYTLIAASAVVVLAFLTLSAGVSIGNALMTSDIPVIHIHGCRYLFLFAYGHDFS